MGNRWRCKQLSGLAEVVQTREREMIMKSAIIKEGSFDARCSAK